MQAIATVKQQITIPTPAGLMKLSECSTHAGYIDRYGNFVFWLALPSDQLIKAGIRADSDKITVRERKLPE